MRVSGKHNDLENVGPSAFHHTFFEMLGNFSFGDYFKREAISYGWEFLTQNLGLPQERLYTTVYQDDDEAFDLWQEIAGVPADRIGRLGKKDNYWAMGDTGPCGPCSEVIYDRGEDYGCGQPTCDVTCECGRWLELWNLVFMQFETDAQGNTTPLPRPSIDTGMGLERIATVMQDVTDNYQTDLFTPIIERTREMLGHSTDEMKENIVSYRVIADHSRALTFLLGDGVVPDNVGRGSILRRILRRAARHGMILGFDRSFLSETTRVVIDIMGSHYVDLKDRANFISQAITREEESFHRTFNASAEHVESVQRQIEEYRSRIQRQIIEESSVTLDDEDIIQLIPGKSLNEINPEEVDRLYKKLLNKELPGERAFQLYETLGVPLYRIQELLEEKGWTVNVEEFEAANLRHQERSRSEAQLDPMAAFRGMDLPAGSFQGYDNLTTESTIGALVSRQGPDSIPGDKVEAIIEGESAAIVMDQTPFYAEKGGQVGDTGVIIGPGGGVFAVEDTQEPAPSVIVHLGRVERGQFRVGGRVEASVDSRRRLDIARNHTATHLLHKALRTVVGEHARQAGSRVGPDGLRFDFTHLSALSGQEIQDVQRLVNEDIRANLPVTASLLEYEEALDRGAIALFGEKYSDRVRMVSAGDRSHELCGGTHLLSTGQIGFFHILSESSIGSGLRRIEAVTGRGSEEFIGQRFRTLEEVADVLQTSPERLTERASALREQLQEQEKEIGQLQARIAQQTVTSSLSQVQEVDGIKLLTLRVEAPDMEALRSMGDRYRDKIGSGVIVLGAVIESRPNFVAMITPDLVADGLRADHLIKEVSKIAGGGGGGRPTLAQAGGKDASKLDDALHKAREWLGAHIDAKAD
jgi:alanyl-tRNA synthetase